MQKLLVNEMFETIQGEGAYTGTPSLFIRLQGCPVGCPWCDTQHTWETLPENNKSVGDILVKTSDSPNYFTCSVSELLDVLVKQQYTAKHIVITGGEPCMYDLNELTMTLHQQGLSTQIETSGTYEVHCSESTWVTVSPKINMKANMPILDQAMKRANEVKHPVAMQKHVDELDNLFLDVFGDKSGLQDVSDVLINLPMPVYLQPISQQKRATELAVATCIKRNWKLSVQLHKYIGVE